MFNSNSSRNDCWNCNDQCLWMNSQDYFKTESNRFLHYSFISYKGNLGQTAQVGSTRGILGLQVSRRHPGKISNSDTCGRRIHNDW